MRACWEGELLWKTGLVKKSLLVPRSPHPETFGATLVRTVPDSEWGPLRRRILFCGGSTGKVRTIVLHIYSPGGSKRSKRVNIGDKTTQRVLVFITNVNEIVLLLQCIAVTFPAVVCMSLTRNSRVPGIIFGGWGWGWMGVGVGGGGGEDVAVVQCDFAVTSRQKVINVVWSVLEKKREKKKERRFHSFENALIPCDKIWGFKDSRMLILQPLV